MEVLTGTGCQVDGSTGNQFITGGREVGSAGHMDPGSMPQSIGTSQKSDRGVSRVEQACHFTGPIQYYFNIGGINCDASMRQAYVLE